MLLGHLIASMLRVRGDISLTADLIMSSIPIKSHVVLGCLSRQEIAEKLAKVVIVGFGIEIKRAAVVKEKTKLYWKSLA